METFDLAAGTARARILDYGARIVSLSFRGRDVFLSYGDLTDYRDDEPYLGAILGRTSGRIAGAVLSVRGTRYPLTANEGPDHLHGGTEGFGHRRWVVEERDPDRLVLRLVSEDGDQGYPGRLEARAVFVLTEEALRVDYEATSDAPTPVSLTHHPYVRLSGRDALDHRIEANAQGWTPLTATGVPTGAVDPVAGTPMDLAEPGRLTDLMADLAPDPLDHGVVCPGGVRVRISDPEGRALTITSDHTHCQLYGAGKMGPPHGPHAGIAVEPQGWPDAERHEAFEDRTLAPGRTYRRFVEYRDG